MGELFSTHRSSQVSRWSILHLKLVADRPVYTCFDFYHNDRHIKTLRNCPVLVMHGQRDDTVPFYHGRKLASTIPSSCRWPPYFPESADHNDIVERDRVQYYHVISKFLQEVWRRSGLSVSDQETNSPAVPHNAPAPFLL